MKWFTPERRQAIQAAAASLAPLLILFGFGTEGVWEQYLIILGAVLQAVSSLLSLVNVRDPRTWAATLRGIVYGAAVVVSPALVLLGYYDEATNAAILTGLSLALSSLSSILAVFFGKQQELASAAAARGLVMQKSPEGVYRLSGPIGPAPGGGDTTNPFGRTN